MDGSSLLLLHWLYELEETMTHFFCGFKYFHEACAALPHPWRPERRSGKVRIKRFSLPLSRVSILIWQR
jgi:hypothetical protein